MTKTRSIALLIVPLFLFCQLASGADYQKGFRAMQDTINACISVKPLPPLLTLKDVEALEKASYDPAWCQILCQMGYLWPKQRAKSLPPRTQNILKDGRWSAEQAAENCLTRSVVGISFTLKSRLIAYVGHQYICDKLRDPEMCRRAREIAIDFLYGAPTGIAVQTRKAIRRLIDKANGCNSRGELRQHCEQLGVKSGACDDL